MCRFVYYLNYVILKFKTLWQTGSINTVLLMWFLTSPSGVSASSLSMQITTLGSNRQAAAGIESNDGESGPRKQEKRWLIECPRAWAKDLLRLVSLSVRFSLSKVGIIFESAMVLVCITSVCSLKGLNILASCSMWVTLCNIEHCRIYFQFLHQFFKSWTHCQHSLHH